MSEETKNSQFYKIINLERLDKKLSKEDVSKAVGKGTTNGYLWMKIKSGKINLNMITKICNACGLEIIIRNPRMNTNHIINDPEGDSKD